MNSPFASQEFNLTLKKMKGNFTTRAYPFRASARPLGNEGLSHFMVAEYRDVGEYTDIGLFLCDPCDALMI